MKRREVLLTICAAAVATVGTAPASAAGGQMARRVTHGFHARLQAKPGMGDAVAALLLEAPSFDLDECLVFLIGRSKSNRDVVVVTEGWTSEGAHARFTQTEVAKAYMARFGTLVEDSVISDEIILGGKAVLK